MLTPGLYCSSPDGDMVVEMSAVLNREQTVLIRDREMHDKGGGVMEHL